MQAPGTVDETIQPWERSVRRWTSGFFGSTRRAIQSAVVDQRGFGSRPDQRDPESASIATAIVRRSVGGPPFIQLPALIEVIGGVAFVGASLLATAHPYVIWMD